MLICSAVFGFFSASSGPTLAEYTCLITGTRLFAFGFGVQSLGGAFGWLLGAPVAGMYVANNVNKADGLFWAWVPLDGHK